MEKKQVLWQNNQPVNLRPPNQNKIDDNSADTQNNSGNSYSSKILELVAQSSLKVDAPEFVPKSSELKSEISVVTSTIQNRLKINRSDYGCDTYGKVEEIPSYPAVIDAENDIKRLRQIISTLTKNPGQFDDLLQVFMETVSPYLEDIILLTNIVEIIVNEAIGNANFRYTGAKLCWYIEHNCPSFRAELHLRCQKKLEDSTNIQDVLLFIAELYIQLPHVNIYGDLLVNAFNNVLSRGNNSNLKYVCQALKLTGYSLESTNKQKLDAIINHLETIKQNESGTNLNLINSILVLRKSNWGMVDTEQSSVEENHEGVEENIDSYCQFNEAEHAFYEEDFDTYLASNNPLTQEEEDYLEELCSDLRLEDDPEMDDEIQEAYEEFLKTCES